MSQENLGFEKMPCQGDDEVSSRSSRFLVQSRLSEEQGHTLEAVHLLLAAYGAAQEEFQGSFLFEGHPALEGLRHALDLCLELGEQNLATHVFGLLEGYLTNDEIDRITLQLETAAGLHLRELGMSNDDVQALANLIAGDFAEAAGSLLPSVEGQAEAPVIAESTTHRDEPLGPGSCRLADLVGYDAEIARLRALGLSNEADDEYRAFIEQLNAQHGIEFVPSHATMVFRAAAREDASRLMLAVAAEMGLPTIRMRIDENALGDPTLCMMLVNGFNQPNALLSNGFGGPGVLLLEDVDMWEAPGPDSYADDFDFHAQGLTPGARRALMLVQMAVADPQVTVMASMGTADGERCSMADLLEPVDYFDVPNPDAQERDALWNRLMSEHVSLSAHDRFELVRLSANLARCDIHAAAIEAVEQAYRESLERFEYVPVKRDNLLDKIAAYQPLNSDEYNEIENLLVEDLLQDIARFESDGGMTAHD